MVLTIGTPDERHDYIDQQFNIIDFRVYFGVEASGQEAKAQTASIETTKRVGEVFWESQHKWYYDLLHRWKRDNYCGCGVI